MYRDTLLQFLQPIQHNSLDHDEPLTICAEAAVLMWRTLQRAGANFSSRSYLSTYFRNLCGPTSAA